MKRYNLIIAFVASILSGVAFAQNVEFKGSNFKDRKDEYKAATAAIKEADEIWELGNQAVFTVKDPTTFYLKAMKKYDVAQTLNPDNGELNFKIGVCYMHTAEKEKGIAHLKKAFKLDPECHYLVKYYLGYAFQLEGDFKVATQKYKEFTAEYKKADAFSKFTRQRLAECKNAKTFMAAPIRVWIDNMESLNTEYNEKAPSISTDGAEIIYSSDRPNGHEPNEFGNYDFDIYNSTMQTGKWRKPKKIAGPVNTDADDISNNLYYDGTKMLFHRVEDGASNIYESQLKGVDWMIPKKMHRNISTKNNEAYASYNHDRYKLYCAREVPGGKSGFDIVVNEVQDFRTMEYGTSQRLTIANTGFNEGPMYLTPDGKTIYFASEGHNSMGGYDIFKMKFVQGQWTKPENLGYPINTQYDDFFFASTANGKFAYIASNRTGGKGAFDIYKVTFWGADKKLMVDNEDYLLASILNPVQDNTIEAEVEVNKVSLTVFKGKTIDQITKKAVEAKIEIVDNATGKKIEEFTTNSATGKFLISLTAGKNYGIAVKADGYLFHSENFDIPNGSDYNLVNKVIELKNIKVGSKIALRNIFFDTGKSTLRSESNAELDRLLKLMKDVPSLKIEISGHTDNTGSAKMNESLSQSRAEAVVNYLVGKGIAKTRMTAMGYGPRKPIASNKSADGRQQNRRTEFEIKGN